jgi:hypothetical protein
MGPRLAWHARWLGHLLWPDDADFVPRIGVVIPVFNRAALAAEAVSSALALDWPAVEVIVVDDGSTDALDAALAPFAGRIQLLRQPNRGVSAARNRGIGLATADLLNFLDSDNLLDPDAARRWIAGLQAVPDADLCFGRPRLEGRAEVVAEQIERRWPTGEPRCPTVDFLAAATRAHPFLNVGTLTARWRVLQVGGFDEALRWGEDTRFWFQLALAGTKTVGLRDELNTRRILESGLTKAHAVPRQAASPVAWQNLLDLLRAPGAWRHVPVALRRTAMFDRWQTMDASEEPRLASLRDALIREVSELGRGGRRDGLSTWPLLVAIRSFALARQRRGTGEPVRGRLQAPIVAALDEAIRSAPPPTAEDWAHWSGVDDELAGDVLRALLPHADAGARVGSPWLPFAELARRNKLAPDPAGRQRWKTLARVESLLGTAWTRRLLRVAGRPLWRLDPGLRSLRVAAAAGHRARSAAWRLNAGRRRAVAAARLRRRH